MSAAAEACRRAVAFIEANGDAFAIWRAGALVAGEPVKTGVLPEGVAQRVDGSFSAGADPAADWDALLAVLCAYDDLRALGLPVIERACRFAESAQADDGGWDPGTGREDDRLFATGLLAGHFGKTRLARASMIDAAGDYLAERFSPERVQGFAWRAIAAFAAAFSNVPHEASDAVLQWVGRELERGFRTHHFDAVRTARVLAYADAPSLPGGRLEGGEVALAVVAEQAADGGWLRLEDPSPEARVAQTLDALTALLRFG